MENLPSLDGFTAANWTCSAQRQQPTTVTTTENENDEEDVLRPFHSHAPFLAGHLGLGDDYLAPPLAELCPNTPQKPKRSHGGTQYKGRGRPRKTDVLEDTAFRPKKARTTRILIEKENDDTSQAEIPNLLRATKLRGLDTSDRELGDLPDLSASCRQEVSGKAAQPHFFYGSSPPGIPNNSILQRYAYPYGLGLDDNILLQQPDFGSRHESFDDESLFDEFIDTDGGNVVVPESHMSHASNATLSLNLVATATNHDRSAKIDGHTNADVNDNDSFGSIDDSLFDEIYEEQYLPGPCSLSHKSSSLQSETIQTQPTQNLESDNSAKDSCLCTGDGWSELDDATLSALVPSLDHDAGSVVSNQAYESVENIIDATVKTDRALQTSSTQSQASINTLPVAGVIVRTPFPKPVRDRSSILGLSGEIKLRTCFRIGEALNTGCHAARCGSNIVLELYVRVIESHRPEDESGSSASSVSKQYFTFADLFHDHGPFITGVYQGWKGVELFEADSAAFLGIMNGDQGIKCRVLGRMQRAFNAKGQGTGRGWELSILSIWEADWDDVKWTEGIFCA